MKVFQEEILFKFFLALYIILYFIPKGSAIEGVMLLGLLYVSTKKLITTKALLNNITSDKIFILIVTLALVQFVSSIFAYNVSDALYQYRKEILPSLLAGFSIIVFYKSINFQYIYRVMSIALLVLGIYYFYESYIQFGKIDFQDYYFYTPRDATFTIPILFPFVIFGLYHFYKDRLFLITSLLAMTLAILLVVYSGSRGAVLAFSIEVLVFIFFTIVSKNWKYILFPLVFGFVLFFISNNQTISKKFHDAAKRGIDPNGRIITVSNFIPVTLDYPFLGIGMGVKNTSFVIKNYEFNSCFVKKNSDNDLISGPHNTFLKFFYQTGFFSLLCYVLIILIVVLNTFKYKKNINDIQGKLAFAIVTVYLDHFVLRGNIQDLKYGKFYLITFIVIALYNTTLKKNENENSIHLS